MTKEQHTEHQLEIRIYFEDTDAGGVVYHGSYLNFGERGRTEFLRAIGHENSTINQKENMLFVVRHISIDYIKPAFLDDLLVLSTKVTEIKNSSFIMRQTLRRLNEIICDMEVTLVCVDKSSLRPVRMPEYLKKDFLLAPSLAPAQTKFAD